MAPVLGGCTALSVNVVEPTPVEDLVALSSRYVSAPYRLAPGDELTVRFYYSPQLDEDVKVRPDGNISLALTGEYVAAGKTAEALSAEITDAYSAYFKRSSAVVIVRNFANDRVFTAGELRQPRELPLVPGARTVLQSIAASGGLTDDATLNSVILVRRLPEQNQPMVAELDLSLALSGEDPSQDVLLMPNDLVYVPKSGAADFNLAVRQFLLNNFNLSSSVNGTKQF